MFSSFDRISSFLTFLIEDLTLILSSFCISEVLVLSFSDFVSLSIDCFLSLFSESIVFSLDCDSSFLVLVSEPVCLSESVDCVSVFVSKSAVLSLD